MKLVIIIPAYNEEGHILDTLTTLPSQIEGIDEIETLVVDDGSTDDTVGVVLGSGKIKLISYKRNRGVGYAFRIGINAALANGADIIVSIDADGQFDSNDIEKLINPILKGNANMVTGSRFLAKEHIPNFSFMKRLGNRIFVKIVSMVTHVKFSDTQCGFRAYSREAALRMNLFGNFTYTQEVLIDLISKGMVVTEVPVAITYKKQRKSRIVKNPVHYGLNSLLIILRTLRDINPLKFFGLPGLALLLFGGLVNLSLLIRWIYKGVVSPYNTLVIVGVVFIVIGSLIMLLAIISDMIGRQKRIQEEILYYTKKDYFDKHGKS